ncbi:MAG: Flp pilus assembly complex ATPase component TadA [Pseudomonadales bacterium]|nr:Flp pilus assembly complex ATPase component TadA [Pseudomonadales bacterium]
MTAWNASYYPSSYTVETGEELRVHNRKYYQYDPKPLGEILIEAGVITKKQLKDALITQSHTEDMRIGEALVRNGAVTPEQVCLALCARFGLPFVKLRQFEIEPDAMKLIPSRVARRYKVMPLIEDEERVVVAVSDPTDLELINTLRFLTHKVLEIAVALPEDIAFAISTYYQRDDYSEAMDSLIVESLATSANESDEDVEEQANEQPIVQLVQNLMTDALVRKASDIHVRPEQNDVNVYFRVDGALQWVRHFSKQLLPAVVSRIKILGDMDISERRLPQDGRARINYLSKSVDLRISVIPALYGESVVIRLLDTEFAKRDFDELGFSKNDSDRLKSMLSATSGIFLVTGPTGSGKTTTLYTAISQVRQTGVNLITVEDPVEYHLDGLTQVQVNHQTGYSFARALRHILRHDPDVIMVGEIRDLETARMAIESALTGHLVLSTLHTNSAASTVIRLLEMGIEPYLVSSTLVGVLAQRLVRCNCPHCLSEENVEPYIRDQLRLNADDHFVHGEGCEECQHSGVASRQAVYELLQVTPEMRSLIKEGVLVDDIQRQAEADGMVPLTAQALELARSQHLPLSEVHRTRLE